MTDRKEELRILVKASRLVAPLTHRLVDVLSTDVLSTDVLSPDFDLNAVYTKCLVFIDGVVSQATAVQGDLFYNHFV
jgi:hypothetical protein